MKESIGSALFKVNLPPLSRPQMGKIKVDQTDISSGSFTEK